MTISIVVPMYNASFHIVKTIESAIAQTLPAKEIIVIDDCSSDDSMAVVEKWKEHYDGTVKVLLKHLETNVGPAGARNMGWELASGEYVAFLDADDIFVDKKFETVMPILSANSDIVLLGHKACVKNVVTEGTEKLEKISSIALIKRNLFATPSVIIKREIPERFDESMYFTEDHDLWLRVTQIYDKSYYLDSVLSVIDRPVRAKGGQSANLWGMRKGEIKMYYKFCKTNNLMIVFPIFFGYSLAKHIVKSFKGRN